MVIGGYGGYGEYSYGGYGLKNGITSVF